MRKQIGKIRNEKQRKRNRRKLSIRRTLNGSSERPRICPFRSNKNLSVQVIDDSSDKTLFGLNTFGKNAVDGSTRNKEGAKKLGLAIGEKLKTNGITNAVFDRNGYKYHGVIVEIAEGIREAGVRI